jgi:hypothetical protein
MAVRTPDIVRRRLIVLHDIYGLSWRKIAEIDEYKGIPFGTLCAIAKGYLIPYCHYDKFGLRRMEPAPVCARCGTVHVTKRCTARAGEPKDLFAMPADELRKRLEMREEY